MTLQNRVDPWGEIHATPERGTLMGNRGGRFHRDDKTLKKRRWASRHWIACELHWKDLHHEPMGRGYTGLFFLDEVTALSAGHRPCFFCRRKEAKMFLGGRKVDDFDRQLHAERFASLVPLREAGRAADAVSRVGTVPGAGPHPSRVPRDTLPTLCVKRDDIPDGAMLDIDGAAFAVLGPNLLRWSFSGYGDRLPRNSSLHGRLLTCASIAAILRGGYKPRWHESAYRWGGT